MKKTFYKIINPKGHNGFEYQVGRNTDPYATNYAQIPSCGRGALYFCEAQHLHSFLGFGSMLAEVKPIGNYVKDSDGNKYKAHSLNVLWMKKYDAKMLLSLPNINRRQMAIALYGREYLSAYELVKEFPDELLQVLSEDEKDIARIVKLASKSLDKERIQDILGASDTVDQKRLIKAGMESYLYDDTLIDYLKEEDDHKLFSRLLSTRKGFSRTVLKRLE